MRWKIPPRIKVHEALGCIADKRIIVKGNEAEVFSSSREKSYSVRYDPEKKAIMTNDNGSYWVGYLGYPSIAFLMLKGVVGYNPIYAEALKDIPWKDVNQKFKNDFEKTEEYVNDLAKARGVHVEELDKEIDRIYEQIKKLDLEMLGEKTKPPEGY
jgi:hypothetical protein